MIIEITMTTPNMMMKMVMIGCLLILIAMVIPWDVVLFQEESVRPTIIEKMIP